MKLAGRNILVTGAGRRIGAALARDLAAAGARIFLHCNRSLREAREVAAGLPGGAARHPVLQCDLAQAAGAGELFAMLGGERLDALVNSASLYDPKPLFAGDDAEFELKMAVNCRAPLKLMRLFAAQEGLESGAIVNLVDHEAEFPAPSGGAYSLSKRLLADLTLAAALELAPAVRANALALGPVLPPEHLAHLGMARSRDKRPLGRAPGLVYVAAGCRFLLENDAVTGQVLYIDGGMHLRA